MSSVTMLFSSFMPSSLRRPSVLLVLATASLLGFLGCDNSIDPFSGNSTYSIYGYLSLSRSQQFVRVKPLNTTLSNNDPRPLDATVTLTNLTDGTSEVLRDSVILFEDAGTTIATHNYWTDTPIRPRTKYRISVQGPEGATTTATTVTPTGADVSIQPSRSGHCLTPFTVIFEGVENERLVQVTLEFEHGGRDWRIQKTNSVYTTHGGTVALTFEVDSILEPVIESVDVSDTFCQYEPRCWELSDDDIQIFYSILGPEWYGTVPQDSVEFDPMQSIDVNNGLGFFGSLKREREVITVDTVDTIPIENRICNS